jgi:hypothetical protein
MVHDSTFFISTKSCLKLADLYQEIRGEGMALLTSGLSKKIGNVRPLCLTGERITHLTIPHKIRDT